MDKNYQPDQIEQRWYQIWEEENYFAPQGNGPNYCIMLPPPNVTGSLHMGHGFQHTLMDALTRYHRMQGYRTLWQPGTDHAGISTQMVVERQLEAAGQTRRELGRSAFLDKVWQWKQHSGGRITQQMRRLGSSVDWTRERFTLDEDLSKAVQHVFIELYKKQLIYRGQRLVNWDPSLQTAISDLEVITQEEQGQLWYIRYPLKDDPKKHLTIATTRPETMLGDTAVAVHPGDERYQAFIGQDIQLPLTDRTIPIIADEYVDPEFGTGCVKITPAHDFNDYQIGLRHELAMINIFNPDATLNDQTPTEYQGLDRYSARQKVIDSLKAINLLAKTEQHHLQIPRGERSGVIVEPYLTDQWFVKAETLAKKASHAVETGAVRFIPENWKNTFFHWMENIEDWCISRQLWWGHRIPAWYDAQGNIYVGDSEQHVRKQHQLGTDIVLTQDSDVLDTWFSSALWPFSTLGWPEHTRELDTFYPNNVLVTGFDIIFFWVARMLMFGLEFTGEVPFKEVYITGLVRDAEGHKMSKSKGNVLDPLDLIDGIDLATLIKKRTSNLMLTSATKKIEQATRRDFPNGIPAFGADALRFTYCALASTARDIRFNLTRITGYRNFCNKLWNAARYILMQFDNEDAKNDLGDRPIQFSLADQWITSRLQKVIQQSHQYFKAYRFDLLAQQLYDFIWHEFCDWYLEFSKTVFYDATSTSVAKRGTQHTLLQVLESALRLLHPIIPFVTEEIWQTVSELIGKSGDTIMLQNYPLSDQQLIEPQVEQQLDWLKKVITAIRTVRSELNIAPKQAISITLLAEQDAYKKQLTSLQHYLRTLAHVDSIIWLQANDNKPIAATTLVEGLIIFIPLAGLIDKQTELARLEKEIKKIKKVLQQGDNKLNNPEFKQKAPPEIVKKEQNKCAELQQELDKLNKQDELIRRL